MDICQQIPDEKQNHHGYHRYCYQKFTNEKYLQKRTSGTADDYELGSKWKKKSHILFPADECIICGKEDKMVKVGNTRKKKN